MAERDLPGAARFKRPWQRTDTSIRDVLKRHRSADVAHDATPQRAPGGGPAEPHVNQFSPLGALSATQPYEPVAPPARAAGRRWLARVLRGAIGIVLVGATVAVVAGPQFMSISVWPTFVVCGLLIGAMGGAYLMALRRPESSMDVERAYSAHLEELSQRLRNLAYRDSLTGLYNHRYFYEELSHEVERSIRYGQPLTVVLMDMDNFKRINDNYGHIAGDKFLGLVGQIIGSHIRASDIGARYGGDEFVVILPNTPATEARATAAKLSTAIEASAAMTGFDEKVRLGVSCGMACTPEDARTPGELLHIADTRLYDAKALRRAARARTDAA